MRRRTFLAVGAAVGFAGCVGGDSNADSPATDTDGAGSNGTDPTADGGQNGADSGASGGSTPGASATATSGATRTRTPTDTAAGTPTGTATGTTPATATRTATGTPVFPSYEKTRVRIRTPGGERLASVTAAIADTSQLRYTGLSDTENLPPDRGMLFVYEEVQDLTYVMREMDFGIDIVYADDEGVITDIHHAPAPGPNEDGNDQRYPGRGQYVLEVNYEFTTERGVETGDVLAFDL